MSLDSLFNILLIVLGFGLLIGIHELGHFIAAKWSGIRTNAFAIGMGPQIISYRGGVGFTYKSTSAKVIKKCGKDASDMTDEELHQYGLSETEYSLRLLPIGGFVSMLGQEDGKPDQVSDDPRSYNSCSIGKRMVVVSAGVVMNLLLAGVFFLICFQIGVNFEAPIIGHIIPDSPAAKATADGQSDNPLQTGDTVLSIDGSPARTFQDIQIAGAMAKPGVPVTLEVQRSDTKDVLKYTILPESVTQSGLLEFGIYPASSLTLRSGRDSEEQLAILQEQYEELKPLNPSMKLVAASRSSSLSENAELQWVELTQWESFQDLLNNHQQGDLTTKWLDGEHEVNIQISDFPALEILRPVGIPEDAPQNFEFGFMGMVPLAKVSYVLETSANRNVLEKEDVILQVGSVEAPRMGQLRNYLAIQPDGKIESLVLRDGKEIQISLELLEGKLGVLLTNALDTPIFAQPLREVLINQEGQFVPTPTAIAGQQLLGGSTFLKAGATKNFGTVNNWSTLRSHIYDAYNGSGFPNGPATILVQNPTIQSELVSISINPSPEECIPAEHPKWASPLSQQLFEPLYVVRSSGGNPVKAIGMGFDETINMVVMTYLTIDRLFRRTVGVEQLRGPVGIIHIGSKIADRGLSYLLFFLAIISVNLAVLNFLPLPIVDGGLFLYLIYEKIFKKPPSIAFQNAAAMLGLGLIATLFIVTFYNDIVRLVS